MILCLYFIFNFISCPGRSKAYRLRLEKPIHFQKECNGLKNVS